MYFYSSRKNSAVFQALDIKIVLFMKSALTVSSACLLKISIELYRYLVYCGAFPARKGVVKIIKGIFKINFVYGGTVRAIIGADTCTYIFETAHTTRMIVRT